MHHDCRMHNQGFRFTHVHIPFYELNQSHVHRLIIEQWLIDAKPEIWDQRLVIWFLCFLCCLCLINLLLCCLYLFACLSVHSGHRLGSNFGFLLGIRSKWVDVDALAFVVLGVTVVSILFFDCCVGCCMFIRRAGIPNFPESTFRKIELVSK